MRLSRNVAFVLLAATTLTRADVAANFTDANPDQYPGTAGAGWFAGWTLSGTTPPSVAVASSTPVNNGGDYLTVSSSLVGDNAIGRRFTSGTGTSIDLTLPTTITFDLRIDTLTGWNDLSDNITVHGTSHLTTFNVSNLSTFIIRAYAAEPVAGKNANEWLFYNGASDGLAFNTANLENSGMAITAGTTYTFTITSDPVTKKYTTSIFNGTTTVSTIGSLGWRSNTVSDSIAINQKVHAGTDVIAYSIDNLTVDANVAGQPDTVANFTPLVDEFKGKAGSGWDTGWGFSLTSGATEPTATVIETAPVNNSGKYLSVSTSGKETGMGREFDSTGASGGYATATTKLKTTFDLRVDSLSGWNATTDYLSVHTTSDTTAFRYTVNTSSNCFIRAYGASPGLDSGGNTLNASEWLLYNGAADGGTFSVTRFVNSGMPVVVGKTYTFTIISDPIAKNYSVSIFDGTNTVTSSNLGWRGTTAADKIAFNQRVSATTDTLSYSLDSILITEAAASDYDTWATSFDPAIGLPGADDDNDGLTNGEEYAFGLKPNDGSSVNPITVQLNNTTGTFTFQCRDQALTDLTYSVWTSTNLVGWTKDETATITPGAADGNSVQQVAVILTGSLLAEPKLFVQVRAE